MSQTVYAHFPWRPSNKGSWRNGKQGDFQALEAKFQDTLLVNTNVPLSTEQQKYFFLYNYTNYALSSWPVVCGIVIALTFYFICI